MSENDKRTNKEYFEEINKKIDSLEYLLKMMLVNDLLDVDSINALSDENTTLIGEIIKRFELDQYNVFMIDDILTVFISINQSIKLNDIRKMYWQLSEHIKDYKIVFVFEQLNGNRRKKLEAEHISFCIKGKEVHIY